MSQTINGDASLIDNGTSAAVDLSTKLPGDLAAVYTPIAQHLQEVEAILQRELRSDTPFVEQLLEHSRLMGGKRIRPVFLLLSAACCGKVESSHLKMAAALEMIHTATLIHDDILDNAETRRHLPTANATWGPKQSVLLGDYLFTHSFHLASQSGSAEALQMLAQASNRVCEGEMRQNAWQGEFDLNEQDYLRMITEKTAELCGVGCRIGAFLSGADEETVLAHEAYGRNLGVSFQIIDDILDIVGQQKEVGKTLGTDLENQKPTLPAIHALENLPEPEKGRFQEFLANPPSDESTRQSALLGFLDQTNSIDYSRKRAQEHAENAIKFAKSLPTSEYSKALILLASFVLSRTH